MISMYGLGCLSLTSLMIYCIFTYVYVFPVILAGMFVALTTLVIHNVKKQRKNKLKKQRNMKTKFTTLLIAISLIFTACNKEDVSPNRDNYTTVVETATDSLDIDDPVVIDDGCLNPIAGEWTLMSFRIDGDLIPTHNQPYLQTLDDTLSVTQVELNSNAGVSNAIVIFPNEHSGIFHITTTTHNYVRHFYAPYSYDCDLEAFDVDSPTTINLNASDDPDVTFDGEGQLIRVYFLLDGITDCFMQLYRES